MHVSYTFPQKFKREVWTSACNLVLTKTILIIWQRNQRWYSVTVMQLRSPKLSNACISYSHTRQPKAAKSWQLPLTVTLSLLLFMQMFSFIGMKYSGTVLVMVT